MATYHTTEEPAYRGLPVQACPGRALRTDILDCLYDRFDYLLARHCRVLVMRFDLRLPPDWQYPDDNHCIQKFANSFTAHLRRTGVDFQYVWARELSPVATNCHWHWLVLLDGRKIRRIEDHMCDADRLWARALGVPSGQGLLWGGCGNDPAYPVHNGVVMCRGDAETLRHCFSWCSYLAKVNTKGNAPHFAKEFGCSQL